MNTTAVQYAGALRHAGCSLNELQRTADYLTGFNAPGELRHFYLLLADKNRFALLPGIVRQLRLLEKRENGEGICLFRCVREPDDAALSALAKLLCRKHHLRAVTFEIVLDETLLGGFTAEIDSVTYDKSVRGQLRALAHDL